MKRTYNGNCSLIIENCCCYTNSTTLVDTIKMGIHNLSDQARYNFMTNLSAFQYALRLLQGKPYGSDNLKYKLLLKGFEENEVKEALSELFEYGYLDDRVYAASYVENLINYKTFGYYGIKSKLKQKMLPNDLIEDVLLKVTPQVEEELAIKYCQLNKKKNKQALVGALSRRGFKSETIYKILNNEDLRLQI